MKNGLIINKRGDKSWYENDQYHRVDGPAAEFVSGHKEWLQNNLLHREDGPAIEWVNGNKSWYIHGVQLNCTTQEQFEKLMRLRAFW